MQQAGLKYKQEQDIDAKLSLYEYVYFRVSASAVSPQVKKNK